MFTPSVAVVEKRKGSGIKIGTVEEVHGIFTVDRIDDMFSLYAVRRKMEVEENNKCMIEQYLAKVKSDGGDFHYFRKQSFGPRYSKLVL